MDDDNPLFWVDDDQPDDDDDNPLFWDNDDQPGTYGGMSWGDILDDIRDRGYDDEWANEHIGLYNDEDFDPEHLRPGTASEFEDLMNWFDDAGIGGFAYMWYDDEDGLWHYAVESDSV